MPSLVLRTTVPAGQSVNAMAGQQYEFPHFNAHVEFAMTTPATGILATIYAGSDLLMQEAPVDLKAANQLPIYPDNFHVNDDVAAGARLNITLRNTTGVAADVLSVVRLNPI